METIKNYLDNVFAALPKTDELFKLKNDLLINMEEKYNELKSEKKSENEAIGIVISEFGNIDELIGELGVNLHEDEMNFPTITEEEVKNYMTMKKQTGILVGIGVFLCITGTALLILITTLVDEGIIGRGFSEDTGYMIGLITLFVMIVPAVALFIYSGMKSERYKYLKKGFNVPLSVKSLLQQRYNDFTSTYMVSLILGVCLCVLSPVSIFAASVFGDTASIYGVIILLIIIAIAVFIFIYYGSIKESFTFLLRIDNFSKENVENNKVIGAVAAILWPLAVCIFLVSGLVFDKWYINWIIFPITGILFGMFSSVYSIIKKRKN
ncbi:permease prefix domain 1-containing protein [Clostridium kluyveri]|uniref:permease prefix domain 1-containing protein n=1 Tax=Clostridium kluyveri TaxID=1534 RepID=UPI002245886A|nr:permease prefix domain 1-containing protein [Clostridium kluyveri]UZQ51390.1 permease prefix domain 1-containing protein [Clostridium kluyveri]